MPITLFEPRSWLERMCDNWCYIHLLDLAADEDDPVTRLKLVVAFAIGGLRQQVSFGKPFNPILGETFCGTFSNGAHAFLEQISHQPPISSWQLYGPAGKYLYWGNGTWSATAHGNSLKGQQTGINCVRFARDGATVSWELPTMSIRGILFGERVLKYEGSMTFRDGAHDLVCDVGIDADSEGLLHSLLHLRRRRREAGPAHDAVRGSLRRGERVLDSLSGSWLSHLLWERGVGGGRGGGPHSVWDAHKSPQSRVQAASRGVLPSDARFRQDLVELRKGNLSSAQSAKMELEQGQRSDHRLRSKGGAQDREASLPR